MDEPELFDWVARQIVDILDVERSEVAADTDLADIGADSIDMVEVINRAEREFGVVIDEHDLYEVGTIGELAQLIARQAGS